MARGIWLLWVAVAATGCRFGGVNAQPPPDGGESAGDPITPVDAEAGGVDAGCQGPGCCEPGVDRDGDSLDDCSELADESAFTDPDRFNGLTATIGERPEWSGSCNALDDYGEMQSRFAQPARQQKVHGGWEFDTDADRYDDPSYGFAPNWDGASGERFSLRFSGHLYIAEDGIHCFALDIGTTGTGIVNGKNMCAQLYLGAREQGDAGARWLLESGYDAESAEASQACVELPAGAHSIDVAFWYFNIFERATLRIRTCRGDGCVPSDPLTPALLQANDNQTRRRSLVGGYDSASRPSMPRIKTSAAKRICSMILG